MAYENLTTTVDQNICQITIDRADKMNALNRATIQEIQKAVQELQQNDEVKGGIITGEGNKAFAAGADISEFAEYSVEQGAAMSKDGHEAFATIEQSSKPIVAAVNGFALGGGCELAMACHLRVAAEHAKFGQPEVGLGIIPGYGGTQRLIQLIGKGNALELLMTGKPVNAEKAKRLGLVNQVWAGEQVLEQSRKLLHTITSNGPLAVSKVIQAANDYFKTDKDGFRAEVELFSQCFDTEDFEEGTQAFLNKRKPQFKGE